MGILKKVLLLGVAGVGVLFLTTGVVRFAVGAQAWQDVQERLAEERIVTADPIEQLKYPDARPPKDVEIPKVLIDTPAEAKAESDVLQLHTFAATSGRTWTELPRPDPKNPTPDDAKMLQDRNTYFQGATWSSLMMESYMAFKVAEDVKADGAEKIILGVSILLFGLPISYFAMKRS